MRTLAFGSALGLLGIATIHCAGDANDASDLDIRDAAPLPSTLDASTDVMDASTGGDVTDGNRCSPDHWCQAALPNADAQLAAVWSFGESDAIATTATSLLHWDGSAWAEVSAPDAQGLTSLWATSPNDVWGVARFGHHLAHGTRSAPDQPLRWSKIEYDASEPSLELIRGIGDSELWAYGRTSDGVKAVQRGIITTQSDADGGSSAAVTWTTIRIDAPSLADVSAFSVTADRAVWLAGVVVVGISGAGGVVRGVPDGANGYAWSEAFIGDPGDFVGHTAFWTDGDKELWSIGSTGQSFHGTIGTDGGLVWTAVPSNASTAMTGIQGFAKNDIWLVGRSGAVRHWDGTAWNVSRLAVGGIPMWQDLSAIHAGPAGDLWAVGNGVALHRAAGGSP